MKITFETNQNESYIELIPETVQETMQLADFAANSLVRPPDISFHFLTSLPRGQVVVKKVRSQAKMYSIRNRKLKTW